MTPQDRLYTEQHEWIQVQGNAAVVGISDFAQNALGDITFVDLPKAGKALKKGDEAVAIESCKAAASAYSPAGGTVTQANGTLANDPGLINRDPFGAGWIYKMTLTNPDDLKGLMDAAKYTEFCEKEQ
jgi:glycine cleavage system H protein